MAPTLTEEQKTKLQEIKKQFASQIQEQNDFYSVLLERSLSLQNTANKGYDVTSDKVLIELILNTTSTKDNNNTLLLELHEKNIPRCSVFSSKNLDKLSGLTALTAENLNLIIEHNDNISPEFCKTIINRFWPNSITGVNIKDAIEGGIQQVGIENLKKIVDKVKLSEDELKNLVSKIFSKQLESDILSLQICKDIIVENPEFNAAVADAIIKKINKFQDPKLKDEKGKLLKAVLEKLLDTSDKDLSKLVAKLCETKDINDTNKSDILNTIVNHEKLTTELAEILLKQYADSINKEQLEKIIGVMDKNPNIIQIIFSEPNTKKLIGELNDTQCIQLIDEAKTTTDLNTILTAKLEKSNKLPDTKVEISNEVADKLVKKICNIYNDTIPPTPSTKLTFFESFVKRPIRTFVESIRDAFPPITERKKCKNMLEKINNNDGLLEQLSGGSITELTKLAPQHMLQKLENLFSKARPTETSPVDTSKPAVNTSQPTTDTKDPNNNGKPDEGASPATNDKHKSPLPTPEQNGTLENLVAGLKVTASVDPSAPKVLNGQQLDYEKFIAQIGDNYTGTKSETTFKIYKTDDTEKKNTLMTKQEDGALVFRKEKEFEDVDAKLFLESIKSLAESSKASTENKLQLEISNFTPKQLDCIRNVVAAPGATPYKELLSKVEFTYADGKKVDLSQKPPQANPQLVARPQNADLPTRPQSAPQRERPKWK